MTGGIYLNMVTKSGSNRWRGDMKTFYSRPSWQSDNFAGAIAAGLPGGIPITKLYDFNLAGGGPLVRNKLWINGAYRNWRVDKLTLARNPDGTRAIDDNLIWNTSGKGNWQAAIDQRVGFSWNYNWKERFHRRDTPPNFAEDRASLWQTNPAASTQVKYTLSRRKIVFDTTFGIMDGVTNYYYQPGTADTDIRIEDTGRSEAFVAAERHEEAPNYRAQLDNVLSYTTRAWGGDHLLKVGTQFAQMGMNDQFWVNGDMHILFNNNAANAVRLWNTPTAHNSKIRLLGILRAGYLVVQEAHAESRRAGRSLAWMDARAVEGCRDVQPGARSPRDQGVQLLAWRVADRRRLRSLRVGPHGDQGQCEPLCGADWPEHGATRAPVPAHQRHAAVDRLERRSPATRKRIGHLQRFPRSEQPLRRCRRAGLAVL